MAKNTAGPRKEKLGAKHAFEGIKTGTSVAGRTDLHGVGGSWKNEPGSSHTTDAEVGSTKILSSSAVPQHKHLAMTGNLKKP